MKSEEKEKKKEKRKTEKKSYLSVSNFCSFILQNKILIHLHRHILNNFLPAFMLFLFCNMSAHILILLFLRDIDLHLENRNN